VDVRHRALPISADGVTLPGDLALPALSSALVVFAHGSGSSRRSPRNVAVAERLRRDGLATLLFDLLTDHEARDRRLVFDIDLLARRLAGAVERASAEPDLDGIPIGLFGASTGAAAALVASVELQRVAAIVSRGGRPDLAGEALERVTVPTLLLVGGQDRQVLELNRGAQARMHSRTRLEVVPGATHLFEEPGALERVAELASAWFAEHAT
jgi:pimeloyl-ACP methyl ester carboxylesterase